MGLLSKLQYGVREVSQHYSDPGWRRDRINARINGPVQRRLHGNGHDYPDADWDTLIILDACRADLFEEVVDTSEWDAYEQVYSGAGATNRWLERQWDDEYPETVYVSGSPMVSRHVSGSFHRLIECWRDAIDEDLNAPAASTITESAIDAHEEYPNKRVVVHYIQPHYPFVRDPDLQFTTFRNTDEWDIEGDPRAADVWEALHAGIVSKEDVWAGYRRNLDYVLEEVGTLLEEIDGRGVVSADHGNLLGERAYPVPIRGYGHPSELVQPSLTTVPWAVSDGPRRKITEGDVESETGAEGDEIQTHLEALGYR